MKKVRRQVSCVMRKHSLRSLSLSYPKKPHKSFFGYDTDYKIVLSTAGSFLVTIPPVNPQTNIINCTLLPSQITLFSRCHIKRRIGEAPPANISLAMTMIKVLLIHVFPWHSSSYGLLCQQISNWRLMCSYCGDNSFIYQQIIGKDQLVMAIMRIRCHTEWRQQDIDGQYGGLMAHLDNEYRLTSDAPREE